MINLVSDSEVETSFPSTLGNSTDLHLPALNSDHTGPKSILISDL